MGGHSNPSAPPPLPAVICFSLEMRIAHVDVGGRVGVGGGRGSLISCPCSFCPPIRIMSKKKTTSQTTFCTLASEALRKALMSVSKVPVGPFARHYLFFSLCFWLAAIVPRPEATSGNDRRKLRLTDAENRSRVITHAPGGVPFAGLRSGWPQVQVLLPGTSVVSARG